MPQVMPHQAVHALVDLIFNRCPTVEAERREVLACRDALLAALPQPENVVPMAPHSTSETPQNPQENRDID